jgi:arylsulfatase A-like enzyme
MLRGTVRLSRRALLAGALAGAVAACGPAEPRRPDVLLVVVDTLRADHLSAWGYPRPTSPRLDALAADALRFTHAQTPRAKTLPAVASLLTGLYPHDHGVRDNATRVPEGTPLLAEALADAGYRTSAIVGNYVLQDARSGLARGFGHWDDSLPDLDGVPPDGVPQRRAASLTDAALAELQRLLAGDRPWLLYLHYMDPHGLYDPPPEHRLFDGSPPEPLPEPGPPDGLHQRRVAEFNVPPDCRLPDGRIDVAAVRARYDGEIRYADAQIGRVLDALAAAGRLDGTLVVVLSDHGEALGGHDYWFEHGFYAYEDTCRVPLLVRGPGLRRGTCEADLSLADLAPTLLDLLDLPPLRPPPDPAGPPAGVSRAGLLREGAGAPQRQPVFCEKIERPDLAGTAQAKAVRLGDWKLIRRYAHDERQRLVVLSEELYDLAADPGEERDLSAAPTPGAPLDALRLQLLRFASAEVRFEDLARQLQEQRASLEALDPEAARILRQMGY